MKNKIHTLRIFLIALILVLSSTLVSAGDFNIYNTSDESQTYFAINGTTGNIGVGISDPTTLLQILNDRWISAKNYLGTGIVNMFKVNENDAIELGATLNIGSFEFNEDSGLVTFVDMPVSSTPAAGTSESYVFKVDGDNIMTVYSEADGSGGVQNKRVGIGTITPQNTLNVIGTGNFTGNLYGGTVYSGGSEVLTSFTETDPYWTGNQSSYFTKSDILGFSYYNLTSFDIADYYLKSNPFSFVNTTSGGSSLIVDANGNIRIGI
ncbi:unnamed protein product [marine sediment metagenome]|uniref:Uncharacterized protein n=1 Tax=marine sediment metagenome TaxID=412755 RepID=X1ELL0_9ZZZZ